jgi:hypothetical protein
MGARAPQLEGNPMLLKLAALTTVGYVGYRFYQHAQAVGMSGGDGAQPLPVAGGPLSDQAVVAKRGEPSDDWPSFEPK